jgi:hypothetical protein
VSFDEDRSLVIVHDDACDIYSFDVDGRITKNGVPTRWHGMTMGWMAGQLFVQGLSSKWYLCNMIDGSAIVTNLP